VWLRRERDSADSNNHHNQSIPFTGESSLVQKQFSNSPKLKPNLTHNECLPRTITVVIISLFPLLESDNYHGWFIQFKSHCRGIGAHLALKARPTHPVDVNGNPLVLNQAQARALAKLQATWDEHDNKANSNEGLYQGSQDQEARRDRGLQTRPPPAQPSSRQPVTTLLRY
jgi:hypothetical protein